MRSISLGLIGLAGLAGTWLVPPAASAETLPDWSGGWSGQATLYAWLPVINGSQEGPDGQPLVDLDTNDVLSRLDMAFMGSAVLSKDRWVLLLDAVYTRLSNDAQWVQDRVETSTKTRIGMYTVAAGYRLYDVDRAYVDLYAGARFFDTQLDFGIATDRRGRSASASLDWADPIVGVHGGLPLSERWSLTGFADVGGFDGASDLSWEVYGGANYAFAEHWAGVLGYRYMSIQKSVTDKAALDIDIQGPVIGVTYKF
jgi:opacity protein-like surface antigen